ncbi:hypothetical protein Tco_1049786, partial [Tanacetum coccineum]
VKVAEVPSASALYVLRRLGSIFTSVYEAVQKLKKDSWLELQFSLKVYKAGKRLLYVKRNKAISLGNVTSKVGMDIAKIARKRSKPDKHEHETEKSVQKPGI